MDKENWPQSTGMMMEEDVLEVPPPVPPVIRSEMGVIEQIYCENFMCHRKMRVVLSPNINFITGQNGSGKSAIIAALQICLGASARDTHRGMSLKTLIRKGHQGAAKVSITLINDESGSDAFQYDKYGSRITVERIIQRAGTTDYRLKNAEGVVVSKSRKDLNAMLDHFNIQIDNPCAVLDQESAKVFLKGDAKDKYKFFLKSTDLYAMNLQYKKIGEQLEEAENTKQREDSKLEILQAARDEAVKQLKDAEEIEKLGEMHRQAKFMLIWSMVQKKEQELESLREKRNLQQQEMKNYEAKVIQNKELVEKLEEKQSAKNEDARELKAKLHEYMQQERVMKQKIRDSRKPMNDATAEMLHLTKHRQETEFKLGRVDRDMKEAAESFHRKNANNERRFATLKNDLLQAETRIAELKLAKEELQSQIQPLSERVETKRNHLESNRQQVGDLHNSIQKMNADIANLKQQKTDSVAKFGRAVPTLLGLINQHKRQFKSVPLGPLGMYVNLPVQHEWMSIAIDRVVGNKLGTFLVTNSDDKNLLESLKRKAKCGPRECPITICKESNQRYSNVHLPEDDLRGRSIATVLEISEPRVFNALIDLTNMENMVVFEGRREAEDRCFLGDPGNQRLPRNVSKVYLKSGDVMSLTDGQMFTRPNKSANRRSLLGTIDVDAEVAEMKYSVQAIQQKKSAYERDYKSLSNDLKNAESEYNSVNKKISQYVSQLRHAEMNHANLQNQAHEAEDESGLDLSIYHHQKEELTEDLQDTISRMAALEVKINSLVTDNTLTSQIQDVRDEIAHFQEACDAISADVNEIHQHLNDQKANLNRVRRRLEALEGDARTCEGQLNAMESTVSEHVQRALRLTQTRLSAEEDDSFYKHQIEDIERRIATEQRRFDGADMQQMRLDAAEKEAKYEKLKMDIVTVYKNAEVLWHMLKARKKRWEKLRKEIITRATLAFNKHLNVRDFAGKLLIDDKAKTINIQVMNGRNLTAASSNKGNMTTDMKALSGGERSYAQTALLLALGEFIECPFRVMDEFDVFMDAINRQITMETLIDGAKRDLSRQYIFVTPNDLSTLAPDDMVKIQKLNPPRP